MRKIFGLFLFWFISPVSAAPTVEELYQRDADIVRMQHFDYYAGLLSEYYQKVQKYPFQGDKDAPVYVFLLNDTQAEHFTDNLPDRHYRLSARDFFEELERGLGRPVNEKYDPQKYGTDGRPTMYIYMIDGDRMFFAVHLFSENAVSRTVAPHYHKAELSNVSYPPKNIYTYEALKNLPEYRALIAKKAAKQDFFDALDKEYSRNSRQ